VLHNILIFQFHACHDSECWALSQVLNVQSIEEGKRTI